MLTTVVQLVAYGGAASVLIPLGPWLSRQGLHWFLSWSLASAAGAIFGLILTAALLRLPGFLDRFVGETFSLGEQLLPYIGIWTAATVLLPVFTRARALRGLPPLEPPGWTACIPIALAGIVLTLHLSARIARSRRR